MRNEQADQSIRKENAKMWIITILEILAIAAIIWFAIYIVQGFGLAEEWTGGKYVLCMDRVNIRMSPNTKQDPIGWLEPGDVVYPDGKKRNGYLHCEIPSIEAGEGWVHRGYLIDDEPEKVNQKGVIVGRGKVKVRKYVNGKRTRWVKPGGEVRVFWWSEEWCLTSVGYIKTKFVELDGE